MENTCLYTVHTNKFRASVATQLAVSFLKKKKDPKPNLHKNTGQMASSVSIYLLHILLIELLSIVREAQRAATKGKKADGDKTARRVTRSLKAKYDCTFSPSFPNRIGVSKEISRNPSSRE